MTGPEDHTTPAPESRSEFERALDWMWEAWQREKARNPDWGRLQADEAHVRWHREVMDALGKLKVPEEGRSDG